MGRREQDVAKVALNEAMRARLRAWALTDPPAVSHVGALLAFTPSVARGRGSMVFSFSHAATGEWAVGALGDAHVKLVNVGNDSARVFVFNAPTVLSRFGFREGNWSFGRTANDAVAISLGALHAGGSLNSHGLKISCPTSGLVLTLMAVLARLDIVVMPTAGSVGVSVPPREVPGVLNRLGLDDIADQYVQLVGAKALGVRS